MPPPHNIDVRIEAGKWVENLSNWENVCRQAANAVLESQWIADTPTELCILLADDAFVQNLNKQYRGQDTPTNVLSFPTSNNLTSPILQSYLGDVVLALETCLRQTIVFCTNSTFSDHICHLVVHGVLHLLGYDHEIDAHAEKMGSLETQILSRLGVTGPYV